MKTILREQAELQSPRGQDSLSLDEPPPPTGGASSPSGGRKLKKVNSLMAACHQGLEHNVSKILWRKVRTSNTNTKVEKILKDSLDSIPSPLPSVKIQIVGGKVYLRYYARSKI